MMPTLSDLADYTLAAWVLEKSSWRLVFDSSDGESVIQHDLTGVSFWQTSELCNGIGVMEIRCTPTDGALAYEIETVCAETVQVICADIRETIIKQRSDSR
jgi:hypothetical protein